MTEGKMDIVERLRAYESRHWETTACYNGTREEAADEIERLRTTLLNIASMPANPRYDWYELVEEMASTARRAALAQEPTP